MDGVVQASVVVVDAVEEPPALPTAGFGVVVRVVVEGKATVAVQGVHTGAVDHGPSATDVGVARSVGVDVRLVLHGGESGDEVLDGERLRTAGPEANGRDSQSDNEQEYSPDVWHFFVNLPWSAGS